MTVLNLGRIRLMLNIIKSYNEIDEEEYRNLADDDTSFRTMENPLLKIIDEEDGITGSTNIDNNIHEKESNNDMKNNNKDKETIDKVNDRSLYNALCYK